MSAILESFNFIPGVNIDTNKFTQEDLAAAEDTVAELFSAKYPKIDFSRNSTVFDMVVRPWGFIYLTNTTLASSLKDTMSLKAVIDNPALSSDAVVDGILSNFNISRRPGKVASGRLRIDVSRVSSYSVLAGDKFTDTSTGITFAAVSSVIANTSPDVGEQPLYAVTGSTQYFFFVDVVSTTQGDTARLKNGAQVSPGFRIQNFITATAFGDFSGGEASETNEQIIGRIIEGLSAKNRTSRTSISAAIKQYFPSVRQISIQGMGDSMQKRDSTNLLGISTGGFCDIYIRSSQGFETQVIAKTAQLGSLLGNGDALYHFSLERDDYPGHYGVSSVRTQNSGVFGGYPIYSQTTSYDARVNPIDGSATGSIIGNLVPDSISARFSRYQQREITFTVPSTESHPDLMPVYAEIYGCPLVKDIQLFINDPAEKQVMADQIVKAFAPCIVFIDNIRIETKSEVSFDAVRTAISDYINDVPPGESVLVDTIISIVKSVPGVDRVKLPLIIRGLITPQDDSEDIEIQGESTLSIPRIESRGVAPECVAFFSSPQNIMVTITPIGAA